MGAVVDPPAGLSAGGRRLWADITAAHELDPMQLVQLTEACRAKDHLDKLDAVLCGDADTWMRLSPDPASDGQVYEMRITNALQRANDTANLMKQLLAALRLPDGQGVRPQRRGGGRGVQLPSVPGGKVSSLDRARARRPTPS